MKNLDVFWAEKISARQISKVTSMLPAITSGAVAVLVGFTSAIAILFQAAQAMGASTEQTSSLIAALCFGAGITSILFSWFYKKPLLMAFSTAGAALLTTKVGHATFPEILGAFVFCGLLITLAGLTGWFEKVLNRIPTTLAAAMLGGVLLRFCLDVFTSMKTEPTVVIAMLATYVILKIRFPRLAVIGVLVTGLAASAFEGLMHFESFTFKVSTPVFTMPAFSFSTVLGIGLPLFVVTMASQNLTGIAVMRAYGYQPPVSSVITGTGLATLLLSPFGAFGINFAAITAAIVMSPEAHEDSRRRYIGAIAAGFFYVLIAIFAATVSSFFHSLPKEFVLALGGIALFSTFGGSLVSALKDENEREAAVLTFLLTASGTSLFGIGSAFWGLIAGAVVMLAQAKPGKKISNGEPRN